MPTERYRVDDNVSNYSRPRATGSYIDCQVLTLYLRPITDKFHGIQHVLILADYDTKFNNTFWKVFKIGTYFKLINFYFRCMMQSNPSSFPTILGTATRVFNFHSIQYSESSSHIPATNDFQSLSNPATTYFLVYIFSTFFDIHYLHQSYCRCILRMVWKMATANQWSKYHHYSVQPSYIQYSRHHHRRSKNSMVKNSKFGNTLWENVNPFSTYHPNQKPSNKNPRMPIFYTQQKKYNSNQK